ncbi:MAG: cell filamentation protein Fic, partial [Bacteroidota bacterium]|nr:cell filamentation protein Fic [Bacteroidota bacterium]
MATVQENLANSLKELQRFQNEQGLAIVKSSDISRVHLVRLVNNGFLQEVMKGWYISSRRDATPGDTTNWYTSYWYFVAAYAKARFKEDWCLTPEQSLSLHSGNRTVPSQIIIRALKGSNNIVKLLHNTTLLDLKTTVATPVYKESQFGLNIYTLPEALIECSPDFFRLDNITARTCLSLISDSSDILRIILEKGQTTKAGRLAGAFRNIGNTVIADEIIGTMKSLGYNLREEDPFTTSSTIAYQRVTSPYETRLRLMWQAMREDVIKLYPESTKTYSDIDSCLQLIEEQYKQDAYNSLSIEGYKVTDDLIEKVKSGQWQPEENTSDLDQKNAMAARGYWQAFQAVKESIAKILNGANAGKTIADDHRIWYRELFAPSVRVGLLKPSDLAGYRTHQVYIKGSMHTPFSADAVRDAIPVLFELLENESNAAVRAILGHFFF